MTCACAQCAQPDTLGTPETIRPRPNQSQNNELRAMFGDSRAWGASLPVVLSSGLSWPWPARNSIIQIWSRKWAPTARIRTFHFASSDFSREPVARSGRDPPDRALTSNIGRGKNIGAADPGPLHSPDFDRICPEFGQLRPKIGLGSASIGPKSTTQLPNLARTARFCPKLRKLGPIWAELGPPGEAKLCNDRATLVGQCVA